MNILTLPVRLGTLTRHVHPQDTKCPLLSLVVSMILTVAFRNQSSSLITGRIPGSRTATRIFTRRHDVQQINEVRRLVHNCLHGRIFAKQSVYSYGQ